jgi:hypothetical protein
MPITIDITDCYTIAQISVGVCTATQISQKARDTLNSAIEKLANKFHNLIGKKHLNTLNILLKSIPSFNSNQDKQKTIIVTIRWMSIYTFKKRNLLLNNTARTARRYNNIVIMSGLFSMFFVVFAPFFKSEMNHETYEYFFKALALCAISPIVAYIAIYILKAYKFSKISSEMSLMCAVILTKIKIHTWIDHKLLRKNKNF